ncbi:MAG: EAL domain-containing protein [Legionellales bacterium]|nr:EAL domain-containing protein [Legionellales bacterium]
MSNKNEATLLIVDDKSENLVVLEKLLSPLPIKILKALSGNEALSLMIEHEVMLVLLDVQMPGMSGYEVREVMSWDEKTKFIPVIFITANYADEQHKLKGYEYGAVDYLYKPIDEIILLSKVKVFIDLYEQKLKYKQLNQRYQLIFNAAGEGIFGINQEKNIVFINPAAETILGYSIGQLINKPVLALLKEPPKKEDIEDENNWSLDDIFNICSKKTNFHKADAELIKNDGTLLPVEFTAAAIYDKDEDDYNGLVFVFSDISLRKITEEQLTNLALYDHLTQLPNRLLFERTMTQTLARAKRNSTITALMFLDLDHFKDVNDQLGHDIGDLLLKAVSSRLLRCIRETDTVSRLGGDEFAIILDQISTMNDAALIAEKIIEALKRPFLLNGNDVFISTSIGIASYPLSGDTSGSLTKNADIAMYQAKQTGRGRYCFFTNLMNEQIRFRLQIIHGLHYAIDRNEFELYYQPKLDLMSKKIVGTEALLRWNHPILGLLHPADFVQIAEETGLIQKIGKWTLEQACRVNKLWQNAGYIKCSIAVNLSFHQLLQTDLISIIENALTQSGLESCYLEVELTETSLIANIEKLSQVLTQLHKIGLYIAIDDFGTGYSSLSHLKKLPIDSLKIDKSFVRDIISDSNDAAIVRAVITLAHGLDLIVIAEGVEHEEQLMFLQNNGCDQVQGFLFSSPLKAIEMEDFFKNYPDYTHNV